MADITMNQWTLHPGAYIREELDARGWSQRDLAFILGCSEQSLNPLLNQKKGVSPDMAKALGDAFDVLPEFFLNLQKIYELAKTDAPSPAIALRAKMQGIYPVREMIKRGWLEDGDAPLLESQLKLFFGVSNPDDIPYFAHAAKKTSYEERAMPGAQLAWLFRVRMIAKSMQAPRYSESRLQAVLVQAQQFLHSPEEACQLPKLLSGCGIRLVIVEKLPQANIDGACFWLDSHSPVVGLTMRYDRIDNFWFVLRHELEHVLLKHGQDREVIDDLDGTGSSTDGSVPEQERVANQAAAEYCVPQTKFNEFLKLEHPFYSEKDVLAFSRIVQRHPGLIVGQMQHRLERYDYLRRHQERIRQYVLPACPFDGWGTVPAGLLL